MDHQGETGFTRSLEKFELDALRWHWGDAYEITHPEPGTWLARRRDGLGSAMAADSPEELRAVILADYTARPVPRD